MTTRHRSPNPDTPRQRQALERLDRFSYWTDSNFRIPMTNFRFGLSPLIGLVPIVGDFIGLLLSFYVLREAHRVGASRRVQARMIFNMLIEFIGGLLPIIGDAFDAIFKANTRNTALLRGWLEEQLEAPQKQTFPWWTLAWLSALIALLTAALALIFL